MRNKTLVAVLFVVMLLTLPVSPFERPTAAQSRAGGFITNGCMFADRMGLLLGVTAFSFALIPGMQPLGVAYGAMALGLKAYSTIKECK